MGSQKESAVIGCYQPQLVPLEQNLVAAVFPLMKIYPAEFCLRQAKEAGWIQSQSLIVESSSGTMAMGLAIVCCLRGYRLVIVSDYACDLLLRRRLEELGTRVEIVSGPAATGGLQSARLARLEEIRNEVKDNWWVNQYDNPCNPGAYGSFAAQLVGSLGHIDCLVGTVGSGGSMCGTADYLRNLYPELTVIGVDTFGSVLFGQPDKPRKLRGLGNSIYPKNLDHRAFDEVHWVTAAEAFHAVRLLYRKTALFCGPTSGAAWIVASRWARQHPHAKVVCIFPDDGYRYLDTVYNDEYLAINGLHLEALPADPLEVEHPLAAGPIWSSMQWNRRTLAQVVHNQSPQATQQFSSESYASQPFSASFEKNAPSAQEP
ncbi:MAG TPA: cysteine synthase family protein [Candidatus Angelobacter sp.]|nr:cysteine synthase family protein [Candidatus Angelobacter sp.]